MERGSVAGCHNRVVGRFRHTARPEQLTMLPECTEPFHERITLPKANRKCRFAALLGELIEIYWGDRCRLTYSLIWALVRICRTSATTSWQRLMDKRFRIWMTSR